MNSFSENAHKHPTRLIIIRHGNTFEPHEIIRRVGGRTDLSLSSSGIQQAKVLGRHFLQQNFQPQHIFVSPLKRTRETVHHMLAEAKWTISLSIYEGLKEIDYGVDENEPENKVIERIGQKALSEWDELSIVPNGWIVDPVAITQEWKILADRCLNNYPGQTAWIVTSNGIARFALNLLKNKPVWLTPKLPTAGYGILEADENEQWHLIDWGKRAP
jgi:broad specificity phosphatase PhoE